MDKKDRIRHQLRSCAEQMQQLLDQLNPNHSISRTLKASISRIRHFNEFDQPNNKVEAHDIMDEFHDAPLELKTMRKRNNNEDDDELIQLNNELEESLPGLEKKSEAHDIIDNRNRPATKWKVVRKRKNSADYDGDDELNQPDTKRAKSSEKHVCIPL
ncbi:hypothetical protein FDENT_10941 [Fusarium denticulatum]|uniref:Uncharacterized protein n=1 Tax=Fusarium denticulatum TaxID=48507 RepID=A0A8H5WQ91_9HYPO|nr:hypothetical protein FDENT_10941 [Fusarium denticulatum]